MGTCNTGGAHMDIRYLIIISTIMIIISHTVRADVCGVYLTSSDESCIDCHRIDNYIMKEINYTTNLTIIEYDIKENDNYNIASAYFDQYFISETYDISDGIPIVIFSEELYLSGDVEIKECFEVKVTYLSENGGNLCPTIIYPPPESDNAKTDNEPKEESKTGEGSGEEEKMIPGEPKITKIERTSDSKNSEESEANKGYPEKTDIDKKNENIIKEKEKELEKEKIREEQMQNFNYIYLVFLLLVIVSAFIIYRIKSKESKKMITFSISGKKRR